MIANFKNNIMTVSNGMDKPLQYLKDGDKWRAMPGMKMVSYDDHLLLNKLLDMGHKAKREGRVRKLNG
jgi:hypothetical protein